MQRRVQPNKGGGRDKGENARRAQFGRAGKDGARGGKDGAPAGEGDRRGPRRPRRRRAPEEKGEWTPVTKLGRLVKSGKIKTLEDIFLFSLPIKEYEIIDYFLKDRLKDEVMKITPVQKQTAAGQRTRFKAVVVVGDNSCHIGLGLKTAREVASAIRGALILAKLSLVPVRKGYWGAKIGLPHTVPCKLTGKCGSVRVKVIPAPRGAGIVAARTSKKVLAFAGIADAYTRSKGTTRTMCNFAVATFDALRHSYDFLSPDLWHETPLIKTPLQEFTDFLHADAEKQ